MKTKLIKAVTIAKKCIIPAGKRVELFHDTSSGLYQVVTVNEKSTAPMSLWLRRDEFTLSTEVN